MSASDLEPTTAICPVCNKKLTVKLEVHMKNKHSGLAEPRERIEKSFRKLFKLRVNEPVQVIKNREPQVPLGDPHYVYPETQTVHLILFLVRPVGHGNNTYISGPSGTGKCLGVDTPVLKYDGTIVPVQDVKKGDFLMGPDSKPREVLATTRGNGPLYKVNPKKGKSWICNDVHVLTLVRSDDGTVIDVPLDEYLDFSAWKKANLKLFQPEVVDFKEGARSVPIDPYFMGVWFGDGTRSLADIRVSKPDAEIERACRRVAKQHGLRLSVDRYEGKCPSYRIVGERGAGNPLLQKMREVVPETGLPVMYLTADRDIRLQFLAGLLDTDGHLTSGCYEIVQDRFEVARDIAFLARSLGFRVTERVKTVNDKDYVRLFISGDVSRIPLKIVRKVAPERRQVKDALRVGFSVEAMGDGSYYGFTLSGDGRFLLGDFTVTHNTQLILNVADQLNWPLTRIDCDSHMTRSSLIGAPIVRNKEIIFQYGALPVAMKQGHILLLNEYDTINPMVANILKPVLDRRPTLVILENGGEVIHAHPDFRVVATANTWARGDDSGAFVNTHIQSMADLRRFGAFIRMDFLDPKIEAQMLIDTFGKDEKGALKLEEEEATDLVKVATKIREAHNARKITRTFSPAEMINWAYTYLELTSVYEAARLTFLNSYSPDEQVAVSAMIEEVWGVERKSNPADEIEEETTDLSSYDPSKLKKAGA